MSSIPSVQAASTQSASGTTEVPTSTATAPAPAAAPTAEAPKPVEAGTNAGPAATLQLSQKALAHLKHDTDWVPGAKIDSF